MSSNGTSGETIKDSKSTRYKNALSYFLCSMEMKN